MRISLQFKSADCLLLMIGWICIWYEGLDLKIKANTWVSPLVLEVKNHSGRPPKLASIILSSLITCTVTWWVQWWQLEWRNGICFADHQHTAKSAHHQHTIDADATIVTLVSDRIVRKMSMKMRFKFILNVSNTLGMQLLTIFNLQITNTLITVIVIRPQHWQSSAESAVQMQLWWHKYQTHWWLWYTNKLLVIHWGCNHPQIQFQ